MTLIGPKRIFGKGESREQNAVIKVYSAAELKKALTKIYTQKGSIGTIQIAGDITITEPIKLKAFIENTNKPKEIIIQSVGGARIHNGNSVAGDFDYDTAGNTEIPVFDIGTGRDLAEAQLITKYTFKDLIINSDESRPFGAFIAANLFSSTGNTELFISQIKIQNLKAFNLHSIFSGYSSDGTFTNFVTAVMCNIDGIAIRNTDPSITAFTFNGGNSGVIYSSITNIGTLNETDRQNTKNILLIYGSNYMRFNSFHSLGVLVKVKENPNPSFYVQFECGFSNIIKTSEIQEIASNDSFSFLSCRFSNAISSASTDIIQTKGPDTGFIVTTPTTYGYASPPPLNNDFVVEDTFCVFRDSDPSINEAFVSSGAMYFDSHYEIDWFFTVYKYSTGETNNYHIKSHIRRGSSGAVTNYSNNTVAASEEFFDLTMTSSSAGGYLTWTFVIPGQDFNVNAVIKMHGHAVPLNNTVV